MNILVTGGAGFIGINLIKYLIKKKHKILIVDKITYASNHDELKILIKNKNVILKKIDVCDYNKIYKAICDFKPKKIMHLAAESHVDRSIKSSKIFLKTNIIGTYTMLFAALNYYNNLPLKNNSSFLFHHISTDEVYGDLSLKDRSFSEENKYFPSSPYSASKASADHFVRAWFRTYGLPVIITNCSNNYGPYQHKEKIIPLIINNALQGKKVPIYGNGKQIRDWLHVSDHVRALYDVLFKGVIGSTYNIGANNELENIKLVTLICGYLDKKVKDKPKNIKSFSELITFVKDRPGHDVRYAINSRKIKKELKWKPKISFKIGLSLTIDWYLDQLCGKKL